MSISYASLKDFIIQKFFLEDQSDFSYSTALFSSGLLDSFDLIDLVSFIETNDDIRIGPMEISLENLDSIDKIIEFVNKK